MDGMMIQKKKKKNKGCAHVSRITSRHKTSYYCNALPSIKPFEKVMNFTPSLLVANLHDSNYCQQHTLPLLNIKDLSV